MTIITQDKPPLLFFTELLQDAFKEVKVSASESTLVYLAGILAKRATPNPQLPKEMLEPLAPAFLTGMKEDGEVGAQILRSVGDTTLILVGYFWKDLDINSGDAEYYVSLGRHSYAYTASMVQRRRESKLDYSIFVELYERFPGLVDAFREVAWRSSMHTPRDVVHAYSVWAKTQSVFAARALSRCGIDVSGKPKLLQ